MPAIRSPVRDRVTSSPCHYPSTVDMISKDVKAQSSPLSTSSTTGTDMPPPVSPESPNKTITAPPKKRRSPNAFILFRSFIARKKLHPPEITNQSELSRYIADKWKSAPPSERAAFHMLANEERRRNEEETGDSEFSGRRSKSNKSRLIDRNSQYRQHESTGLETGTCEEVPYSFTTSSSTQDVPVPTFYPFGPHSQDTFRTSPLVQQPVDPTSAYLLAPGQETTSFGHTDTAADPSGSQGLPGNNSSLRRNTGLSETEVLDVALAVQLDLQSLLETDASSPIRNKPAADSA